MYSSSTTSKTKTKQFSRLGTFADLLVRHVRSRGGDAPAVYSAARIDRRTYSSIVSHPFRPVAKRTAIQKVTTLIQSFEYLKERKLHAPTSLPSNSGMEMSPS